MYSVSWGQVSGWCGSPLFFQHRSQHLTQRSHVAHIWWMNDWINKLHIRGTSDITWLNSCLSNHVCKWWVSQFECIWGWELIHMHVVLSISELLMSRESSSLYLQILYAMFLYSYSFFCSASLWHIPITTWTSHPPPTLGTTLTPDFCPALISVKQ